MTTPDKLGHGGERLENSDRRLGLTPAEFAALFGRGPTWGYRKLYSGEVRRLDVSGRIIIPMSEVRRFTSKTVAHGA